MGQYADMIQMWDSGPLILTQVHRPSPVGSRPVIVTRWAMSSVTIVATLPYCCVLEIGSSVVLFAYVVRNRRK